MVAKQNARKEDRGGRRIVGLKVREVSAVDRPVNTVPFLIRKRLETEMGAHNTDDALASMEAEVSKALVDHGFSFVEIDAEKQLPPALKMAFAKVIPWMRSAAADADPEVKSAVAQVVGFLAKVASGSMPTMDEDEEKKKAKATEEDEEKKKAAEEEEDEEKKGKTTDKKKALSLDDLGPELLFSVTAEGGVVVEKGRRQFTPERLKAFSAAATDLLGILKEADQDAFTQVIAAAKELPSKAKVPASISKADIAAAVAEAIKEPIAEVAKRIEEIEKTRAPSKQPAGDGTNGKTDEVKKSLWGGIL